MTFFFFLDSIITYVVTASQLHTTRFTICDSKSLFIGLSIKVVSFNDGFHLNPCSEILKVLIMVIDH